MEAGPVHVCVHGYGKEEGDRGVKNQMDGYPSPAKAGYLMFCLVIAYIYSFADRQLFALLVNPVKASLGISDFRIGLIQGLAFSVFFCLAAVPIGRMVDRYDRRWLVIGGIVLWSFATAACGLATGFTTLFLARICVGVGEAVLVPAAYSMIPDAFRPERVVRAMAIFTLGATLGSGLAFLFGGTIIKIVTGMEDRPFGLEPWRLTFMVAGALSIVAVALLLTTRDPPRRAASFREAPPLRDAFAYIWARRGDYVPLYFSSLFFSTTAYAALLWYPTHLVRVHHIPPGDLGLLIGTIFLIASPLGTLISTTLTERLAARGHRDASLRVVLGLAFILLPGSLAAIVADLRLSLALFAVMAFCQGGFAANIIASLQFITPSKLRGLNSSIYVVVLNLGSLGIGSALVGAISDMFPGQPEGISYGVTAVAFGASIGALLSTRRALARFRLAVERTDGAAEA